MSRSLTVEFYALYQFRRTAEKCAQVASTVCDDAIGLAMPPSAFTELESSKKIHDAWQTVCKDREQEAKALQDELEAMGKVLESVAGLYGWTDGELATAVAKAARVAGDSAL